MACINRCYYLHKIDKDKVIDSLLVEDMRKRYKAFGLLTQDVLRPQALNGSRAALYDAADDEYETLKNDFKKKKKRWGRTKFLESDHYKYWKRVFAESEKLIKEAGGNGT